MTAAFSTPVDIANRALQHVGGLRISAFTDNSRNAAETSFLYDKARRAELTGAIWKFAKRRLVLRSLTATTELVAPAAWAVGTTYAALALVTDAAGIIWQSLQASNTGNTPADGSVWWGRYYGSLTADTWSNAATYYIGELVLKSTTAYISTTNANTNNDPASGAPWLSLGTVLTPLVLRSPLGYGRNGSSLKNVYRMPYGFLRLAMQDPKAASVYTGGTSGGVQFSDWEISGRYLLTADASPIFFQFIADIADVTEFDDLFCEGLAARMGFELTELLTQSPEKAQLMAKIYSQFMAQAQKVNAIELGSTEAEDMAYQALLPANPESQAPQQRGQ